MANALGFGMRAQVHVCGVQPAEPRPADGILALDEVLCPQAELVVARFHSLARQRSRVLDDLLANSAEAFVRGRIISLARMAAHNTARTEACAKLREFFSRRVVG